MSPKIGLILLICLTVVIIASSEVVRYDNYQVYKITPSNRNELAILKQMEDTSDSLIFLDGIHSVDKAVMVVVAPHKIPDFLLLLKTNDIDYELKEKNLQKLLEKEEKQMSMIRSETRDQWTGYQQLEYTYSWLQRLCSSYPGIATLIEAGKSYEKRSILGVKISYPNVNVNATRKQKSGIFLEAGIHAREWISPATATYIINELLTSDNVEIRELAEQYDWYIFPHTNPDGYVYTHKTNRLWRKTRQPYGLCYGADPNRNWNISWSTVGASRNPCSDTYAGSKANSEIEIKSLTNYLTSLKSKIHLYISFHSYSQYLLYPYGYSADLPDNVKDFERVYNATIKAISKRYSTIYTGGNIYDAIYPSAGSSVDYVYTVLGIRMAFAFELRPNAAFNGNGMELPADQIKPTGEETLDGIVAMVKEVKALGYFNK